MNRGVMEYVKAMVVPDLEWKNLLASQEELLVLVRNLKVVVPGTNPPSPYITAMEFMNEVRIGRTKFDQLVRANRIRTIKKGRKIYVPVGEV